MDTVDAARRWAAAWKSGWEALDPEPILELYAEDAVLSTEPFREPYRGRDGVRAYVARVLSEEEDPRIWMAEPIVDARRAAISWWASLIEGGTPTTLAGNSTSSSTTTGSWSSSGTPGTSPAIGSSRAATSVHSPPASPATGELSRKPAVIAW